jgi:uncharacterized membrane-anchored protein
MTDNSSTNLPSPFGRGAGGEGSGSEQSRNAVVPPDALTLALSRRERGPASTPAWLESTVSWLKGRERTLLVVGVAFQLLVLVGMIVRHEMPYWTGETILLRVVPVDPRDMFRGDYVTLGYDFSRIPAGGIPGLDTSHDYSREPNGAGQTVYVSLTPEADGKHWRAASFSVNPPTSGKYIRGTITNWNQIQFGIESYYVQEGEGQRYEDAVKNQTLSAKVSLAPDGTAALRGLMIEPKLSEP